MIHETAIIDPQARLAEDVIVGPYTVIEGNVEIGSGTKIGPHVFIKGNTKIGKDNTIAQFASIGEDPQDLKFKPSDETWLEIGDRNTIREYVTLNRGTIQGGGFTKLGDDNLLMAYAHLAHDCIVGNRVVMANNASLAGHIVVDDYAILGGLSAVHQYCRIGAHSFAAGGSMIAKDVLPFTKVSGYYAKPFGINVEGLKRHQFTADRISKIRNYYKLIYRQGLTAAEAITELMKFNGDEDAGLFLELMKQSQRGIVR